ncbi:MAG: hypothetical protein JWP57_809 [Spirosoma sp.]|nr:hypothetical protein [Spirosoma sp.]
MDFLTAFPYWAILVIMVVNAIAVQFMKINVQDDTKKPDQ